jgi:MFS-type transporter involved in bile tolerance (Atg22 family)
MKEILNSIGAVLAGFIFIGITHTSIDAILESAGVLPKGSLFVEAWLILIVIGYRAIFSIAGCYISAWLAPNYPMRHSIALGVLGAVFSSIGAITMGHLGPAWYAWTLAAISIPIGWLGGKLYEMRLLKNRTVIE